MRTKALVTVLGFGMLLSACGSLLGLEDRKLDETDLDETGYQGCEPTEGDCDGCITEAHEQACRAGVGGASSGSNGSGGTGGSSASGGASASSASGGTGGSSGGSSGGAGGTGGDAGSGGMGGTGGFSGSGGSKASGGSGGAGGTGGSGGTGGDPGWTFDCRDDLSSNLCFSCLCAKCDDELDECQADPECGAIWDCVFEKGCSPEIGGSDNCYQAEDCKAVIDAAGGLEGQAYAKVADIAECGAAEDCCSDTCQQGQDCGGCMNCYDSCICSGGSDADCQDSCDVNTWSLCNPLAGCDNCGTCMGTCLCEGTPEATCLSDCGLGSCSSGACSSCATNAENCLCGGNTTELCFEAEVGDDCWGYYTGRVPSENLECYVCGCQQCPVVSGLCLADSYCPGILDCMQNSGCSGAGCADQMVCGDVISTAGGMGSYSVQLAEGIIGCRADNHCANCPGPVLVVQCTDNGGQSTLCYSYAPGLPDPIAPACCPGMGMMGAQCGLDARSYLPNAPPCAPANGMGDIDDSCQGYQVDYPNYSHYLEGCCRPDATCGLMDTTIGLACVPPGLVGAPMSYNNQPCTP